MAAKIFLLHLNNMLMYDNYLKKTYPIYTVTNGVLWTHPPQMIIKTIVISSFCNARLINPLGSLGAAVWQPQRTPRLLSLRQGDKPHHTLIDFGFYNFM